MVVTEKFYIGYRDVDANLNIKNSAILNIFEDIAGIHASQVGESIKDSDTTWLLTGYKVKIFKRPQYGDRLVVDTWGTEIKSITASREFEIRSESGEVLIIGLSNWVHINLRSKKIEKVSEKIAKSYEIEPEKTNFGETKLEKLKSPESFEYEKEYTIDWNWIDANDHMNNVFYMDLADIVLPDEISKENIFTSFEIMYKKEIKYKDKVKCLYSEAVGESTIVIKSMEDDEIHSIIKLYR